MESLNLNVDEYTNPEIEEILSLQYPYQNQDVITAKGKLHGVLTNDNMVDINTKIKIENFLETVSKRLINDIESGIKNASHVNSDFYKHKNTVIESNDHFIITHKERREESFNLPSQFGLNIGNDGGAPPGIINPIKYTTIKRALNIDSRFRPNYYKTNSADQKLSLPYKFENIINMRLASIEIPLSYYAVSKSYGNNTFIIGWDIHPVKNTPQHLIRITIPDGNYETSINKQTGASNIESVINAALQSKNQDILLPKTSTSLLPRYSISEDPSFNLVYTVDHTSGRSIFAFDPSGVCNIDEIIGDPTTYANKIRYRLFFGVDSSLSDEDLVSGIAAVDPLPFYLGWQLGYRTNLYDSGPLIVDLNNTVAPIIYPCPVISEGLCYIKGPQYIFVAIEDYNNNVNNYYISAYTDSINNANIIARINLATVVQNNGVFQTGEDDGFSTQINRSRNYFGPVNIEKLRITLLDEYGRIVNLNNMDWSCALMFEQVYDGGVISY